jgi:pantoate--beta-alanine ligase
MGALHHGHLALVSEARKLAGRNGTVVVSIFVNPTQFGPTEDFAAYPRPVHRDRMLCRNAGVDLLFMPPVEEMIFPDASVFVHEEDHLSSVLCGRSRPGHFRGVCTVVAKLFHIVDPDIAIFGEKDWQQLAILRRMARDLFFRVKIVGYPIVREPDGLAVSSRNVYLSDAERETAPGFCLALRQAVQKSTPAAIEREAVRLLSRLPGCRVDYVQVVDSESLQPAKNLRKPTTLAGAIFLGRTRLIDNIQIPIRL